MRGAAFAPPFLFPPDIVNRSLRIAAAGTPGAYEEVLALSKKLAIASARNLSRNSGLERLARQQTVAPMLSEVRNVVI